MNSYGLSLVGEMLVAVWDGGDKAMEACDSFEVRGRMGGWTSKLNMGPYGCGLWRSIRMRWDGFRRYIRYEVGMGNWVLFSLGC